jgi:hypothetical protein
MFSDGSRGLLKVTLRERDETAYIATHGTSDNFFNGIDHNRHFNSPGFFD